MSGNAAPTPTGGTGSGKSNVALIISLCINLLLVGIIAMAVMRVHFFPPPPFGGPGMMQFHGRGHGMQLWQMQQSLTPQAFQRAAPAKAAKIESIIGAHRPKFRELGASSIDARRQAFEVFSQPNFDKKAFDDSLARVQATDAALEKEILSVVSESAGTLTPEERKAVAAERGNRGGWFWHHGFGHRFGPPGDAPGDAAPNGAPPGPPPGRED
jgi:uncharacterized membrane protein